MYPKSMNYHIALSRVVALVCVGMGMSLQAEPEEVLTLRSVLAMVERQNPELAGLSCGVLSAEGTVRQAGAWANPTLGVDAEEFGGTGAREGYESAQTTVRLTQPVDLGGKRVKRQGVAQVEARLAKWDYEAKRRDVLAQAKTAYVDVLLAQGRLKLAESLLGVATEVRLAVAERVKAGKVTPLEDTKAGVEVAKARIERDRVQSELGATRKRLAALWGATASSPQEVAGDLAVTVEVPAIESLTARLADVPEVARWNDEVVLWKQQLELAKAERVPDMDVSVGVRRFEEDGSHAGVAGLSLPLPVFSRNAGALAAAKNRALRAEYEKQAARVRVVAELGEAFSRLAMARAEAQTTRTELLPGAQQAFEAAQIGYKEGKSGYLEVLDAQRTLGEVNARYLDVLAVYHKGAAEVERLTGVQLNTIQ